MQVLILFKEDKCQNALNSIKTIRLNEIDAPESDQPFGTESKQALVDMLKNRQVRVEYHSTDNFNRIVGEVLREPDWPSYPGGVFVELTPVPSTGFAFSHWSGAETASANPLVWEVIGNAGFTATFVPTAAVGGSADLRPGLAPVVPNPARGQISLAFTLPGASRARLTVLDVAGRVIDVIADGQFEQGTHRASWKTSEVARARGAGLYFVCLEAGALREVRRVAVTR